MNTLALLLGFKILVTLGLIQLFLFAPQRRLNGLMAQYGDSPLPYRLYGLALLALVIGYGVALARAVTGEFDTSMVVIGLLSNAGAALLIQTWSGHPTLRRASWLFATIAMGLLVALAFPAQVLVSIVP